MDHLIEGSLAPDFQLLTAEGTPNRLSQAVESGPIALAFYKASCPTCQFTFPFVEKIFDELGETAEPRIWGISQDDRAETVEFVAQHGLTFPVLIDEHPYEVSRAYEVRFVPTLYLIDGARRVRMADFGFSKPALELIARTLADEIACPAPKVFSRDDGLPVRRPG